MQASEPQTKLNRSHHATDAVFAGLSHPTPSTAYANLGAACVGTRLLNLARAAAAMHMAQSVRYTAVSQSPTNHPLGA